MAHDESMLAAYRAKKDLYATIAQNVYHNDYWDNMEHHQDGTPNPEGKKRRAACKSILLGIMYGRGVASIADQTGCSVQEAQKIIDDFYRGFPAVKKWTDETQENAKKLGYVEDFMGRRRRLPDIQRPPVDVCYVDKTRSIVSSDFNPLIGSTGKYVSNVKSDLEIYREKALSARGRQAIEKVKQEALSKGIEIHENGGFIAQAERQCVNARIQGGASTITKLAMIRVHSDPELNQLGFRMLICVHDELIGECPEENAERCGERLSEVMIDSVKDIVECPMKCDAEIEPSWYFNERSGILLEQIEKLEAEGKTSQDAVDTVWNDNSELSAEQLCAMLPEKYMCNIMQHNRNVL